MTEITIARRRVGWRAAALAALAAALLCGALATSASANINVQRVSALSATDSSSTKYVTTPNCPSGMRVIGTGASIIGGGRQVTITRVEPGYDTVWATAAEDWDGTANDWQLKATAICGQVEGNAVRVEVHYRHFGEYFTSDGHKSVIAYCPAGTRVLGSGGRIVGGEGRVVMDAIEPTAGLDRVEVHAQEDRYGTSDDWGLVAYAICVDQTYYPQRVAATGTDYLIQRGGITRGKSATASCPSGKHLLGSGGQVNHPHKTGQPWASWDWSRSDPSTPSAKRRPRPHSRTRSARTTTGP
jgi:hypothetical protein